MQRICCPYFQLSEGKKQEVIKEKGNDEGVKNRLIEVWSVSGLSEATEDDTCE